MVGVSYVISLFDPSHFSWPPILEYIESKYEKYLNDESRVNRGQIEDYRVHCCLYFIPPNGHGLRQIDIEFMKQLHEKVSAFYNTLILIFIFIIYYRQTLCQ